MHRVIQGFIGCSLTGSKLIFLCRISLLYTQFSLGISALEYRPITTGYLPDNACSQLGGLVLRRSYILPQQLIWEKI